MRTVLIVVLIVAALFAALLLLGGSRKGETAGPDDRPPSWAEALGTVTGWFAPKLELSADRFELAADASRSLSIGRSDADARVGRFRLTQGSAALLQFDPADADDGEPQLLCLHAQGITAPGGSCEPETTKVGQGSIIVWPSGGTLTLSAPNGAATLELAR